MYVSKARKTKWTPEEDNSLRIAVSNYPYRKGSFAIDWKAVSKQCARTTKQCRERWINVLDPAIRRDAWTFDEIRTLFNAQEELGNKWAAIASRLPGRPETAVKNTFYAAVRREQRRSWAAKHGQPIPEPFHPAVPHVPACARLLASMGEAMPPLPSLTTSPPGSRSSSFCEEDGFPCATPPPTPLASQSSPTLSKKRGQLPGPSVAPSHDGSDHSFGVPEADCEDDRPRKFSAVHSDAMFDDIMSSEFFASASLYPVPGRVKSESISDADSESLLSDSEADGYMAAAMMDPFDAPLASYALGLRLGVDADADVGAMHAMSDYSATAKPVAAAFPVFSPAHATIGAIAGDVDAFVDALSAHALDINVDDDFSWLQ